MTARAVDAGRGRRLPIPRPPDPIHCLRGFLAVLAALAVLATPVQCSLAMGAHSLFVDPRDMMAMAADHAGHAGHMGHKGHSGHAGDDHAATATDANAAQPATQSGQVDVPALRQLSGFVDAAPPVAIGGSALTLTHRWAPAQAHTITADALHPADSWAESPPP